MFYYLILAVSFAPDLVECNITTLFYDEDIVQSVGQCLQLITNKEFHFNQEEFMIITKTYNQSEPGNEIQNEFIKKIFSSARTTVMIIGGDEEDSQAMNSVRGDLNHHSETDNDNVDTVQADELFVQSHVMFIRHSDFYVMIIDSYRMYNSKIKQLVRVGSWNARAPIVVYLSRIPKNKERMIHYPEYILHSLWTYHSMNAIVLVHDWKNSSIVRIHSWKPYDPPERCGENNQNLSKIMEVLDICHNGILLKNSTLFKNKIPKNLKGCPIKILGVIWHPFLNHNKSSDFAGFDRDIINVISERLNFTVDLNTTIPTWGNRLDNGSWDGIMGGLIHGYGEVGIGAIYPDNNIHEDYDATISYLQDSYVWIVPRARELPQWENLVIILRPTMWIATGVVYCICTVVWYIFANLKIESGINPKDVSYGMLDSWCINLCASMVSRPVSNYMRVYFVAFCLYGMVWSTVYQTKLITVFTNPSYEHQISEVDELLKSKLKFGGNEAFKFLFNNSIDKTEDHFFANYIDMDIHEVLEDLIKYRNLSVLTSKMYMRYLSATTLHYNDAHGVPLFYTLKSNVFSFPVEMVMIKGFAFLDAFNELIALLKSNGLIHKVSVDFKIRAKRMAAELARQSDIHEDPPEQRITLDHLQGAFMILALGLMAAGIILIGEFLVSIRSMKLNKKEDKLFDHKKRWFIIRAGANNNQPGYGKRMRNYILPYTYHAKQNFMKWSYINDNQTNVQK